MAVGLRDRWVWVACAGLVGCAAPEDPLPPNPYTGEPLEVAEDGEWHFVQIEGMACADGEASGVGVRRVAGSDKLVVYFKGGGACFNQTTCGFTDPLMVTGRAAMDENPYGVLDFARDENPLLEHNIVYFPYCTGDVHAGTAGPTPIDGVAEPWSFVGHSNVVAGLDRIVPTFSDISELVVWGTSAGGLGAMVNFPYVREGWPRTPTAVVDDSGLALPDAYLAPCLQQQLRDTWGFDGVLPQDCPDCRLPDGGGLARIFAHMPDAYPDVRFSLIASQRDQILRLFYGFGNDECSASTGVPDLGEAQFASAVDALRAESVDGRFSTFVIDSDHHTWSTTNEFYSAESGGVRMRDWLAGFLAGDALNVEP